MTDFKYCAGWTNDQIKGTLLLKQYQKANFGRTVDDEIKAMTLEMLRRLA